MEGTTSKKRVFKIVTLVVLAVALIGFLIVINLPRVAAMRSLKNFAKDITKRDEIKPIAKTLKRGSIEFALEGITEIDEDGDKYELIGDDYYTGKLYFKKNKLMLDNFDASIGGVELQGQLYVSDKEMYVTEENILEGSYGVKYSELLDELKDSIFAPDADSDYSIDEETFDIIVNVLESIEDIDEVSKDVKKTAEKVLKDILDIVLDNADISAERTSVRVGGKKTKVRQITIAIDGDALSNIIMEVYEYLRDSKKIQKLIDEYDDALYALMEATGMSDEYDSFSEAYDDILDLYEDRVEDLCEDIEDDFEELEIKISTPKRRAKLLKLEIEYDGEELFTLDCGKKGIKNTKTISVELGDLTLTYEISVNNRKAYESELKIKTYSDDTYTVDISIDKKADSYEVVYKEKDGYYDNEDKWTITGTISTTMFGKTSLTVDKIVNKWTKEDWYYGTTTERKTTYKLDCSIVIDTWDRMPKREKNYSSISDITEDDIETWVENIEDLEFDY